MPWIGARVQESRASGLLSNQGEKSINFYFIIVPLRKKVLKYGTPKPRFSGLRVWSFGVKLYGFRAWVSTWFFYLLGKGGYSKLRI